MTKQQVKEILAIVMQKEINGAELTKDEKDLWGKALVFAHRVRFGYEEWAA